MVDIVLRYVRGKLGRFNVFEKSLRQVYTFDLTLMNQFLIFQLYCRVRPQIPVFKDVQPLLEIDRDERKLDVFLTFHRSSLLVSDMKIFLPFTINLDPYIKKKIKEEQQNLEEMAAPISYKQTWNAHDISHNQWINRNRNPKLSKMPSLEQHHSLFPPSSWVPSINDGWHTVPWMQMPIIEPPKPMSTMTALPVQ